MMVSWLQTLCFFLSTPLSDSFSLFSVAPNNRWTSATRTSRLLGQPESTADGIASTSRSGITSAKGLYRPFAEHAWSTLLEDPSLEPKDDIPEELLINTAVAKGFPPDSIVRMETRALIPTQKDSSIRYARYALLETLVPNNHDNSTEGIQVLNLVIFPSQRNLPVFGADMVSLPGGKHLLLLDAQPMAQQRQFQEHWNQWHETHVQPQFPWGGDMPEQVQQYVSDRALWTRLVSGSSNDDEGEPTPIHKIQTQLWDAFQEHLEVYLDLLLAESANDNEDDGGDDDPQGPYIQYRLENDPARPMLKSLYGEEWTERVLHEVLFPQPQKTS
ncbi:Phycoerythrobilin:ferredoxin oxidoreductase [Seminavis robusta]|uniref:Phycoerythrobilin:ferredoxin oxidoreductase n=1 Tax=Seminavis robusta TaxID=568900 RepID=A0A9N8F1U3_9STRA|nr:Phycoerythrobilin:ferredoxin oxidoreductase [Seminavis robusta]|eukprot:Sro2864_g338910.1 Phycoerythrobilin:ferredoxin oxidoreductase (330) ;mRNA; r:7507-8496